jgi:hypothetical protein
MRSLRRTVDQPLSISVVVFDVLTERSGTVGLREHWVDSRVYALRTFCIFISTYRRERMSLDESPQGSFTVAGGSSGAAIGG